MMGSEVTPYVGVWIETIDYSLIIKTLTVTPYVGVWIETGSYLRLQRT